MPTPGVHATPGTMACAVVAKPGTNAANEIRTIVAATFPTSLNLRGPDMGRPIRAAGDIFSRDNLPGTVSLGVTGMTGTESRSEVAGTGSQDGVAGVDEVAEHPVDVHGRWA